MMKKLLVIAGLLASPALAQNVQQSGTVTRGHVAVWNTSGVLADGGSSASSPITSIGVTNSGGSGICVNSALPTSPGYQALCFGASTAGPATISLQNFGTATAQNLQFVINGTPVVVPTGGAGFVLENPPFVAGHASCFQTTAGILNDCGVSVVPGIQFGLPYYSTISTQGSTGAGTAGQFLLGQGASVPLWASLSGDVTSVSAGGVLTLGKVNGIPFNTSYGAHGVLLGQGSGAFTSTTTSNVGNCLLSQGLSSDPVWASCASGSGSAGGATTQVQFNSSSSLVGSANLTWATPALTIGVAGTATGQLQLAAAGNASGVITLQNPGGTTAFNLNMPATVGTAGQPLLSGGGGTTPMTFGTLGLGAGGTNCAVVSGTCLDNITGFSSTGFIQRTGAGTYAFSTVVPVSGGGTNLANGTSGGILGYTAAGTLASSVLLTQFGLVVGGGAGATPTAITPGSAGQILIQQTSANPSWNTMSGDATIGATGALTIVNSAVTLAKQANMAAFSLQGNFTGSSTAPQASTLAALTLKASPATGDDIMIGDNSAAGAIKRASVSSIAAAGSVSSIAGNTGAFTLTSPITNATNAILLNASIHPQGRITLTTTTPVMTSTVAGATTVFYTPYAGNLVPIYDGTNMIPVAFSEVSQATTDATKSPAAVAASKVYDVFCWVDAGTNRCTRGPAWTNSTTRGYTFTVVNGILLNTSTITNGPSASRGTWVGTIASNASSTIDYIFGASASGGTAAVLDVWNEYNRVLTPTTVTDSGVSYSYAVNTVRNARGSSGNQIAFVVGAAEDSVIFSYGCNFDTGVSGASSCGIGFDVSNAYGMVPFAAQAATNLGFAGASSGAWSPGIGTHALFACESQLVGTGTFDSVDYSVKNMLAATIRN